MKRNVVRKYTEEFRNAAVSQVLVGGRSATVVARSLEISSKTMANWIGKARKGQVLIKRSSANATTPLEAELTQLRQEVARLRIEKEILKKAAAYFAKESL
jgi:transposase